MAEYVVFVGVTKEQFDSTPVDAAEMLTQAGAVPATDFTLEALTHKGGAAEREYEATDKVDLGQPDKEKFFRAVPKGGGRA